MGGVHSIEDVPGSIADSVSGYHWTKITIGASSARTYRLRRTGSPTVYLKIDSAKPKRELDQERRVLGWLEGKLPVPRVLKFDHDEQTDFLLLSEVPGTNAAELVGHLDKPQIVVLLSNGLKMVHGLSTEGCPFERSLDSVIQEADFNVKNGLVREDDFDQERKGKTANNLFRDLLESRPSDEDLVFTHGDYCLPNVIINANEVTGFVDLHRAGVGDRYRDIALAVRSIKSNLGDGYDRLFFEEYGLREVDQRKIEYYQLVDEFF